MRPEEIATIADLVRRRSGVVVDPDKTYLIESRLAPVARREGFASIRELIRDIAEKRAEALVWPVVEAMSCIETQFFRDRTPFDQMRADCKKGQPESSPSSRAETARIARHVADNHLCGTEGSARD